MTASRTALHKALLQQPRQAGSREGAGFAPNTAERPSVRGKFLYVGDRKYWVKGVTYGTFRPDANGRAFPDSARIELDFAQMAREGMNAVRVYTAPPRALLDVALRYGLKVMV